MGPVAPREPGKPGPPGIPGSPGEPGEPGKPAAHRQQTGGDEQVGWTGGDGQVGMDRYGPIIQFMYVVFAIVYLTGNAMRFILH